MAAAYGEQYYNTQPYAWESTSHGSGLYFLKHCYRARCLRSKRRNKLRDAERFLLKTNANLVVEYFLLYKR